MQRREQHQRELSTAAEASASSRLGTCSSFDLDFIQEDLQLANFVSFGAGAWELARFFCVAVAVATSLSGWVFSLGVSSRSYSQKQVVTSTLSQSSAKTFFLLAEESGQDHCKALHFAGRSADSPGSSSGSFPELTEGCFSNLNIADWPALLNSLLLFVIEMWGEEMLDKCLCRAGKLLNPPPPIALPPLA